MSTKQILCLVHGSGVGAEEALGMEPSQFTISFLKSNQIPAQNISAADLGPCALKDMGLKTAQELIDLGFDALYLNDRKFASEANLCFGSKEVIDAFLVSAQDAVSISGSDSMEILDVRTVDLLRACAGAATEACAVLQQLPVGRALDGVPASILLDTGLRKATLMALGYSLPSVVAQTSANASELSKLGFGLTSVG